MIDRSKGTRAGYIGVGGQVGEKGVLCISWNGVGCSGSVAGLRFGI